MSCASGKGKLYESNVEKDARCDVPAHMSHTCVKMWVRSAR